MNIFNHELKLGERFCDYIKVGELACFSDIRIPVVMVRGKTDGPVLWLTGAVHGDELNGLWAMRRLFWDLDPETLHGTVIITSILNPIAFWSREKLSTLDHLDMDQQFPGNPQGLYSERMAYLIFQELKTNADYVIDFHTLNHLFSATPYTVSKVVEGASVTANEQALALARAFGVYPNCSVDLKTAGGELPGTTSGALDILCMQHNIPCFMAEMGGGGRWEEDNIEIAYQGIKNVMDKLQMVTNGEKQKNIQQIVLTKRKFLRVNRGGMVRMAVKPGDIVSKGALLATVNDFASVLEEIYAETDLFMIATCFNPIVSSGDRLAFAGTEWHECDS